MLIGTAKPTPAFARRSLTMAVFMPMTSPRTFSSGPPELPGLIAASVCSISFVRPGTGRIGRASAETTPTVTVWLRPNGAPMAMTQSPGAIRLESPRVATDSSPIGPLDQLEQGAVGQAIAAEHARLVPFLVVEELHLDARRVLHHVVVGQDQPRAVDDEAGAGRRRPGRFLLVVLFRPLPVGGRAVEEAAEELLAAGGKNSSRSRKNSFMGDCGTGRCVQMVTTVPVCAAAMSRNVVAVRLPAPGVGFDAVPRTACAARGEAGSKSDATAIPTSMAAAATAQTNVVLNLDILSYLPCATWIPAVMVLTRWR